MQVPPSSSSPETRIAVLETRQEANDEWRKRMDETMSKVADALQRLTKLDLQNETIAARQVAMEAEFRAVFKEIFERLKAIEAEMPTVKLVRDAGFAAGRKVLWTALAPLLSAVAGAGGALFYVSRHITGG